MFDSPDKSIQSRKIKNGTEKAEPLDALIIGAGFSGIGMAVTLNRMGKKNWLILELAKSVGGTWRDNRYPGCACDVPSRLYSFSFERNPDWSRKYSGQPEIEAYLNRTAKSYDLEDRICFDTKVERLDWLEIEKIWEITTVQGRTYFARHVIAATGPLRIPSYPAFKGQTGFSGRQVHTAMWPDDLDLTDKKVAIIGTGASAIQVIPAIVEKVASLTVFQRTPPWIIPRGDLAYSGFKKWVLKNVPGFDSLLRGYRYLVHELLGTAFFRNPKLTKPVRKRALKNLKDQVPDPALRKLLTPRYQMGCKRIIVSDDYLPAMAHCKTTVVPSPFSHFKGDTLCAEDGTTAQADIVIYATGFEATRPLKDIAIHGVGGEALNDRWDNRVQAYLGTMVNGFPNLYILTGPNTGIGHTSVIYMSESQYHLIRRAINMADKKGGAIDVKPEIENAFVEDVQNRMKRTVWQTGCSSWYIDDTGYNGLLWPDYTFLFRRACKNIKAQEFTFP